MKMKLLNRGKGVSLRAIHIAMIVCAVVISLLLVFSTYQSASVFSSLSKAAGDYSVRQKAAHELMEASDYLTEMVQRFTLEGNTQYLDDYFEEVFVSRRREESITSMSEGDTEKGLVTQLQEAMTESTSLSSALRMGAIRLPPYPFAIDSSLQSRHRRHTIPAVLLQVHLSHPVC